MRSTAATRLTADGSAQQSEITLQPFLAPTTLPSVLARSVAFAAIMVTSICGGLIGSSVTELQCSSPCTGWQFLGAGSGALFCAVGVALVAVLVLRSKGEWAAES